MSPSIWQSLWLILFIVAGILFFGTMLVVAVKGLQDVKAMIGRLRGRKSPSA